VTATSGDGRRRPGSTRAAKRERQRQVRELVTRHPIASQHELVERLAERGFDVTQATISRDISELGLVKVMAAEGHVYASPDDLAPGAPRASDDRLRRVLADYPVTIGRSGLILLLVSEAGTASAIAQAIDESTLDEQEGTLAGDNTVLVLFADEDRLQRWRARFERIRSIAAGPAEVPRR
jgi:transcriptional regulator of arginine metabolism